MHASDLWYVDTRARDQHQSSIIAGHTQLDLQHMRQLAVGEVAASTGHSSICHGCSFDSF